MRVLIISPKNKTLINFRGDLIKEIISRGHEVVAIGPDKQYIEDIKSLGIKFFEVPFVKDNTSIFGDIKYYQLLKRIIAEIKPDIVFSYTIKPVIYGSISAKKTGVKKIYPMITGLGRVYSSKSIKARLLRKITGILYKMAFSCSNKVIFQNKDDLELFVKLGYLPRYKATRVNGSGVNMEKFAANGLPQEPVFIMIARIIKQKGVFEYLEAAKLVKNKYPEARFILLGGFDSSIDAIHPEVLKPYISSGIIEFPGEKKNVIPYLEQARVFVLPTYYREGIPRTILEAMSMGRPIITTDWPGCREAVLDGYNGYLVKPKDINPLAEKMIYLIENPNVVESMSINSFKLCKEKFDVNLVNNHLLEIMEIR